MHAAGGPEEWSVNQPATFYSKLSLLPPAAQPSLRCALAHTLMLVLTLACQSPCQPAVKDGGSHLQSSAGIWHKLG